MILDISVSGRRKAAKKPTDDGWRKVREFENGTIELEGPRGRRMRGVGIACLVCGRPIFTRGAFKDPSPKCLPCFNELETAHNEAWAERRKRRYVQLYEQSELSYQRRHIALALAKPKWRDRKAIAAIYKEAQRKTVETGVEHHVDHIYPIQSPMACGLHVHWNLQVMVGSENCSKSNDFPLDQSPAWDGMTNDEIVVAWRAMVHEHKMLL